MTTLSADNPDPAAIEVVTATALPVSGFRHTSPTVRHNRKVAPTTSAVR